MAKEFSVKNNEELSKIMEHGSYEISKSIVENIIDTRIISLLEVINNNYPDKFDKKLISKELSYIKEHIDYKNIETKIDKPVDKPIDKPLDSKQNNKHNNNNCCDDVSLQCSGRVWSNNIYNS